MEKKARVTETWRQLCIGFMENEEFKDQSWFIVLSFHTAEQLSTSRQLEGFF